MKKQEYLQKIELMRIDAINYLNGFLMPLLRDTEIENEYIEFFYLDTEEKEMTKIHKIGEDGMLYMFFDYGDHVNSEDVPLERLGFVALIQLVEILEEVLESKINP